LCQRRPRAPNPRRAPPLTNATIRSLVHGSCCARAYTRSTGRPTSAPSASTSRSSRGSAGDARRSSPTATRRSSRCWLPPATSSSRTDRPIRHDSQTQRAVLSKSARRSTGPSTRIETLEVRSSTNSTTSGSRSAGCPAAVASLHAAALDARIDSVLAVSAGAPSDEIRVPIAFVTGGPADIEAQSATETYRSASAPSFLANHVAADHFLMTPLVPPIDDELAALTTNWLELTLFDDLAGSDFVLREPCGICGATWQAQSKDWGRAGNRQLRPG
jgi:hypothetical protein